jgi:hypothetical protein
MPIHVDIRINETLIKQIHIGRIRGSAKKNSINTYLAYEGDRPETLEDWFDRGTEYEHRYGDGAEVCVAKALKALGYNNES